MNVLSRASKSAKRTRHNLEKIDQGPQWTWVICVLHVRSDICLFNILGIIGPVIGEGGMDFGEIVLTLSMTNNYSETSKKAAVGR